MSIPFAGLTPVYVYSEHKSDKASILTDNKGKSCVYMWTNKVNGKIYIGSSVDLSKRLRNYFNTSYLSDLKILWLFIKLY